MTRIAPLASVLLLAGCIAAPAGRTALPFPANRSFASPLLHAAVGFSVDTPDRANEAASEGITSTILYNGSAAGSSLEVALQQHHISVIDGGVSSIVFYWECHRTHTVALPPASYAYNYYCRTDEDPSISSEVIALARVSKLLDRDATRPYVAGYWVLDDWASWDYGSGQHLLQKIRALIASKTPGRPAICGFGAEIGVGTKYSWDPGTAKNYSKAGCDMVGWYNYSPFGLTHPSNGDKLNWAMTGLLPAMGASLAKYGWNVANTPLMGIGQAWSGKYGKRDYQPGLSVAQMQTQASAFCNYGATSISWYAWDDSQDVKQTQTPNNSPAIAAGIAAGLSACRSTWGS